MATDKSDIFISLIESNRGIIYKIVNLYCKNHENRKDLVQEIIFQLWRSFDKYDSQYRHSTWMYRISLNVAISFYRKSRKNPLPLDESFLNIEDEGPHIYKEDHMRLLQTFISDLNPLDKALILLYLEEKSQKEIAEILGISSTNVATKIGRIKTLLKQKFTGKI